MSQSKAGSLIARIKDKKVQKTALNVVILVAVFGLGLGVGANRIKLGPDGVFHKTLQQNSGDLSYDGIDEIYQNLRDDFDGQLDTKKLNDGLKAGLVKAAGDPFTEYLNVEDAKSFDEQLNGSFEGIGAELDKDQNVIVIVSPIAGFPAEKAGLKPRDIISKINGETAYDLSVSEAVKKIRGPKGTSVKLEVIRDGKSLNFEITREQISTPSVKTEITPDNIGIITISRFGDDTVSLTQQAATDMKSKNVKGVILDMRGNPGGLLDAAVGVSSLWVPKGKLVLQEKRGDTVVKTHPALGNTTLAGVPTVVLINDGSASASEITAGALKDNGVATIIGEKSFGKGSVQELLPLKIGGVLKVTIAHWFTPNGTSIDKQGIEPDQKVEISDADAAAKKDTQKEAALAKLAR